MSRSEPVPEERAGRAAEVAVLQLPYESSGSVEDPNANESCVRAQCITYRRRLPGVGVEGRVDLQAGAARRLAVHHERRVHQARRAAARVQRRRPDARVGGRGGRQRVDGLSNGRRDGAGY